MSLVSLNRKCKTCSVGRARVSAPGSATMSHKANSTLFNKVSSGPGIFSINGSSRHSHYIGRGSHRAPTTQSCLAQSTTVKPSVVSNAVARRNATLTRANDNVVQPDANFPDNDSQGTYIFNKKFAHDCVVDTHTQTPDCAKLSNQNCGGRVGNRLNPTTPFKKDFAVAQSYDDYLSKNLLPKCTKIEIYPKKINNNGITNARCG